MSDIGAEGRLRHKIYKYTSRLGERPIQITISAEDWFEIVQNELKQIGDNALDNGRDPEVEVGKVLDELDRDPHFSYMGVRVEKDGPLHYPGRAYVVYPSPVCEMINELQDDQIWKELEEDK